MAEGYTLKEMIQELRTENRQALDVQTKMVGSLENIDKHLEKLNSKVATQERKIANVETFQTRVMTVWTVAITVLMVAVNKFI